MQYENDNRLISLAELERLLCEMTHEDELTDSGCYHNGTWFSTESIMEFISRRA